MRLIPKDDVVLVNWIMVFLLGFLYVSGSHDMFEGAVEQCCQDWETRNEP